MFTNSNRMSESEVQELARFLATHQDVVIREGRRVALASVIRKFIGAVCEQYSPINRSLTLGAATLGYKSTTRFLV